MASNRGKKRCWPWTHDWEIVTGLTVPMFDPGAKGILKTCRSCGKVVAK